MSHEIEHIAASQETSHQVGGGCTLCFAFIPLIWSVGDKRCLLAAPLIILDHHGYTPNCVWWPTDPVKRRPSISHGKSGWCNARFCYGLELLGIYWASAQTLPCARRLYYTSMVFAWLTVLYVCCMCCFVVFMAGAMAGNMARKIVPWSRCERR